MSHEGPRALPKPSFECLRTTVAHVTAHFYLSVASCARLGCVFASSWRRLGASWARLGRILARLGSVVEASERVLGASWRVLGASWRALGTILGGLGRVLPRLGAVFGRLGAVLSALKRVPFKTPSLIVFQSNFYPNFDP